MKDLKDYIMENLDMNVIEALQNTEAHDYITEADEDEVSVRDLVIKYSCPKDVYVQVPEKYSESDVQIYLDDKLLPELPAETQEDALGKNYKEINDCYFEYEVMEPSSGTNQKADLEWDDNYDQSANGTNMVVQHIKNMKYVIKFERFYLNNIDNDDAEIKDTIFKLFDGFVADTDDDLPFDITLSKDHGIEFKKA